MAVQSPPFVLQNASHPGKLFRQAASWLVTAEGVLSSADQAVTANATPAMNVDVALGYCWIKGDSEVGQGYYFGYNDATVNLAIASADGSNPRIDIVIAQVNDSAYSGSANTWELKVVTGSAAGSPSVPTLPANALKLAQVAVGAGVTTITSGNITDSRTFANVTVPGTLTVGSDGAGKDVIFYSDTAGDNLTWDSSAEALIVTGTAGQDALKVAAGNTTVLGPLTVGVDDTGHDVKFFGATATNGYMLWDESTDDLVFGSASKVGIGSTTPVTPLEIASDDDLTDFTSANRGAVTLTNTDHATNDYVALDFRYNVAATAPSARIAAKMTGSGSQLVFGTTNDYAGITNEAVVISNIGDVTLVKDLSVTAALSKGSGTFDIAHPTRSAPWRLRHSFIEGPKADLIYRGTATIGGGGTVAVDLDAASGMTAGTWEALNQDPWSMVSSSGNSVTWAFSGKTLTITGTAGAVCQWLVIGERKDQTVINWKATDADGHLITEYDSTPPAEDNIDDI